MKITMVAGFSDDALIRKASVWEFEGDSGVEYHESALVNGEHCWIEEFPIKKEAIEPMLSAAQFEFEKDGLTTRRYSM